MGKSNNNSTLSESFLPLTQDEEAIIYGTILGDANIQKRNQSYRLKIDHSIEQQQYVFWKHKQLKRLCQTTQAPKETIDTKGHKGLEFYTSSGKYLQSFHELFYEPVEQVDKNGNKKVRYVKKITQKLIQKLPMHPMVLATFFLDDGSVRNDCYAGKIATQGFTEAENCLLCDYLAKWDIEALVVKHTAESGQFYLTIPASNGAFKKLVSVISPIVKQIPDMVYKLNENRRPRND